MITRASSSESKRRALSSSSRSRSLNDSIQAFCNGEPGSMKSEAALVNRHQSVMAWAMNSGPLSKCTDRHHRRRLLRLEKPSELEAGAPLTTTREQDLLGVISPDGSIRMVKITDDAVYQGWFTDKDTIELVITEVGSHAVVGTRTASRVGS
jgi:hypothetical protein